jgi:hypothetical protein
MRVCDVHEFIREAALSGSDGGGGVCTRIWQDLTRDFWEIGMEETVKALSKLMAMVKTRSAR